VSSPRRRRRAPRRRSPRSGWPTGQAIDFHPTNELFLTAGLDKTLRLFRLDGVENPKVQGVRFDDLPLTLAAFTRDGRQVVAAGRGAHAYTLDLATSTVLRLPAQLGEAAGKAHDGLALSPDGEWLALSVASSGTVLLLAARSKQLVGTYRMNRRGAALAFVGGGLLASGSKAGEVYLWDVRSQRCACRLHDEGLSDTTALAADAGGTRLAVGSASGVVNVYDSAALLAADGRAPPLRAVSNLTTASTALAFSHDARLLALASKHKRNALRVAHVPTLRVYANWPTSKTPIRHSQCVAFHPRGRYFASGDDRGHVLLYKLPGYTE
jgi:U3 small nucleolar RNA-associated protein 18